MYILISSVILGISPGEKMRSLVAVFQCALEGCFIMPWSTFLFLQEEQTDTHREQGPAPYQ